MIDNIVFIRYKYTLKKKKNYGFYVFKYILIYCINKREGRKEYAILVFLCLAVFFLFL